MPTYVRNKYYVINHTTIAVNFKLNQISCGSLIILFIFIINQILHLIFPRIPDPFFIHDHLADACLKQYRPVIPCLSLPSA